MQAKSFSQEVLRGVEVAVASTRSEILLGVREAFVRYFHQGLERPVPVAVVPQESRCVFDGLAMGTAELVERCGALNDDLEAQVGDSYHFFVAVESGFETVGEGATATVLARFWSEVRGLGTSAGGGSGSITVPEHVLEQGLRADDGRMITLGARRRRSLLESLTSGLETRRTAASQATFNALASLFFSKYSGHPIGP